MVVWYCLLIRNDFKYLSNEHLIIFLNFSEIWDVNKL